MSWLNESSKEQPGSGGFEVETEADVSAANTSESGMGDQTRQQQLYPVGGAAEAEIPAHTAAADDL